MCDDECGWWPTNGRHCRRAHTHRISLPIHSVCTKVKHFACSILRFRKLRSDVVVVYRFRAYAQRTHKDTNTQEIDSTWLDYFWPSNCMRLTVDENILSNVCHFVRFAYAHLKVKFNLKIHLPSLTRIFIFAEQNSRETSFSIFFFRKKGE